MNSTNLRKTNRNYSCRYESKFVFDWNVRDFDCQNYVSDSNLPSIKFYFTLNNIHFKGQLSLCGENCEQRKCRLNLESRTDKDWEMDVKFSVCEEIDENFITNKKASKEFSLAIDGECSIPKNNTAISCELSLESSDPTLNIVPTINRDLSELFKSKQFWDVTFVVDGRELYAHKCLLISRCELFATMFSAEMLEAKSNKVVITDIKFEIFEQMLRYIYTDEVLYLEDMASELLIASEKYNIETLKDICESKLINKISIGNAADLLLLADLNGAKYLKERAFDFIKTHAKAVASTEGWQAVVKDHVRLVVELYMQLID